MLDDRDLIAVTDIKQYTYCPRVFYFHACLPDVRPTTYKMQAGIDAGEAEREKARRRSLAAYHMKGIEGIRYFDVAGECPELRLVGIVDEVVEIQHPQQELIPVDYKLSRKTGYHFKIQLAAYAEILEAAYHVPVRRGFLYLIPLRRAEEVPITSRLRGKLRDMLSEMARIADKENMPSPCKQIRRCLNCEFRRFCNDV